MNKVFNIEETFGGKAVLAVPYIRGSDLRVMVSWFAPGNDEFSFGIDFSTGDGMAWIEEYVGSERDKELVMPSQVIANRVVAESDGNLILHWDDGAEKLREMLSYQRMEKIKRSEELREAMRQKAS